MYELETLERDEGGNPILLRLIPQEGGEIFLQASNDVNYHTLSRYSACKLTCALMNLLLEKESLQEFAGETPQAGTDVEEVFDENRLAYGQLHLPSCAAGREPPNGW